MGPLMTMFTMLLRMQIDTKAYNIDLQYLSMFQLYALLNLSLIRKLFCKFILTNSHAQGNRGLPASHAHDSYLFSTVRCCRKSLAVTAQWQINNRPTKSRLIALRDNRCLPFTGFVTSFAAH